MKGVIPEVEKMALSEEEWEGVKVQVGARCDLQCLWGEVVHF